MAQYEVFQPDQDGKSEGFQRGLALMLGRFVIGVMLMIALVAGAAMYYLQVYAFYDQLDVDDVRLTSVVTGEAEEIAFENFKAIDSISSPVRYRACYETIGSLAMLTETYVIYDAAEPLVAPDWFDCFDARTLGADLEDGTAIAFLGVAHVQYGIDRVVAIYPDGRAFAWQQINDCGEVVFDGDPVPEDCPTPPEVTN